MAEENLIKRVILTVMHEVKILHSEPSFVRDLELIKWRHLEVVLTFEHIIGVRAFNFHAERREAGHHHIISRTEDVQRLTLILKKLFLAAEDGRHEISVLEELNEVIVE